MKQTHPIVAMIFAFVVLLAVGLSTGSAVAQDTASPQSLKLHAIFTDHMVLQRDKPIKVWGWATPGQAVTVTLGGDTAEAKPQPAAKVEVYGQAERYDGLGRWEVVFSAREASAEPIKLTATSGDETIELSNIVLGDVWVGHGQSNMAWSLDKTINADMEIRQANLPMLRHFRIKSNEQATLQDDIRAEAIINGGWEVSSSDTAGGFSAIAYVFGAHLQRATGVPIGIISNARGGASIESMVPGYKFAEDPLAAKYKAYIDQRMADFDPRAKALEQWDKAIARAKRKNFPEDKWPSKPVGSENLRSWDIPGKSPSDAASIYNGMFGVFKGLNIKGVIFHQGYNNAMTSNCRPKRYRVLTKLMVEGWREQFNQPDLPVAIIGFCAGGDRQHQDNFELMDYDGAAHIRESQRLGLADVGDPDRLAFIPAYDVQIPGLHPKKKAEHGIRAARWALNKVYGEAVTWDTASLVTAEADKDTMVLTFDKPVYADNWTAIPLGFSIAGKDGKYYRAHARYATKDGQKRWTNARHSTRASSTSGARWWRNPSPYAMRGVIAPREI